MTNEIQSTHNQWPIVYVEHEGEQIPFEVRETSSPEKLDRIYKAFAEFLIEMAMKSERMNAGPIKSESDSLPPKAKKKKKTL